MNDPEPINLSLLLRICHVEDEESLSLVKELSISVDTKKHGPCDEIGYLLPKLQMLFLSNSALASIRDFGTSMRYLRVLKAPHCGLTELDGISALFSLEELYVSFNEIWDLSSISLHDSLQVLDLEANNVDEMLQLAQLGTCTALWNLTLTGCPILKRCCSQVNYRRIVFKNIQSLQCLDDEPITSVDQEDPDTRAILRRKQRPSSVPSPLKLSHIQDLSFNGTERHRGWEFSANQDSVADMKELVSDSIKMFRPHRETFDEDSSINFSNTARPFTTGSLRDNEVFSLLHHARGSAVVHSSKSSSFQPRLPINENSRVSVPSSIVAQSDKAMPSSLTHGESDVFSGNAIRGLRHRYRKSVLLEAAEVDSHSTGNDDSGSSSGVSSMLLSETVGMSHPGSKNCITQFSSVDQLDTESIGLCALRKRAAATPGSIPHPQECIDSTKSVTVPPHPYIGPGVGAANLLTDAAIVSLLRMRPKDVPQLKTRSGFQRFFHGKQLNFPM